MTWQHEPGSQGKRLVFDHTRSAAPGATPSPVPEGQECPTCMRRVPRRPKPSSPQTKTKSYRIPVGDWDEATALEIDTAKHLGVYEKSHWQYWTHHYAMTLTRMTGSVKDALKSNE